MHITTENKPFKKILCKLVWSPRNAEQSRHARLPSRAGLEYARAIQESLNKGKQRTEHEDGWGKRKERMRNTSLDPEWEEGGVSEGAELEWLQNWHYNMGPWLISEDGWAELPDVAHLVVLSVFVVLDRPAGVESTPPLFLSAPPMLQRLISPDRPVESWRRCPEPKSPRLSWSSSTTHTHHTHTHTEGDEREGVDDR